MNNCRFCGFPMNLDISKARGFCLDCAREECRHCQQPFLEHIEENDRFKCLYDATTYTNWKGLSRPV